jgi:putative mRNA 3-end processing factor
LSKAESILYPTPSGLYCEPGQFYIDPHLPVDKAMITHAHSDHARSGHGAVLASQETCDIMKIRLGADSAGRYEVAQIGQATDINGVSVKFVPAGHVLGSCQIVVEHQGIRICVSGDYKRRRDPTCAPFEPVKADVFVTEATFGLPVFVHPDAGGEVTKLLDSLKSNPENDHFIGAYSLGKAQRIVRILRDLGHDDEILLHGSMETLCSYYQSRGVELGKLANLIDAGARRKNGGSIIIGPPSAIGTTWVNRMADPVFAYASGWMRIRQRAKRAGVELPLIVSDHCDWPELQQSILDSGAGEIWVTHGNEDGLVRWCAMQGIAAKPLGLVGFSDEGD